MRAQIKMSHFLCSITALIYIIQKDTGIMYMYIYSIYIYCIKKGHTFFLNKKNQVLVLSQLVVLHPAWHDILINLLNFNVYVWVTRVQRH